MMHKKSSVTLHPIPILKSCMIKPSFLIVIIRAKKELPLFSDSSPCIIDLVYNPNSTPSIRLRIISSLWNNSA